MGEYCPRSLYCVYSYIFTGSAMSGRSLRVCQYSLLLRLHCIELFMLTLPSSCYDWNTLEIKSMLIIQDDGRVIIKGSVQWNADLLRHCLLKWSWNLGTCDHKYGALTTRPSACFNDAADILVHNNFSCCISLVSLHFTVSARLYRIRSVQRANFVF